MIKHYDFILTLLTVILLGAFGILSLLGTGYSWAMSSSNPNWTGTFDYLRYLSFMNTVALPLILLLGLVAGACVPKRILSRYNLLAFSGVLLVVTVAIAIILSPLEASAFLLFATVALQTIVSARAL